jgi:hypothetical protein
MRQSKVRKFDLAALYLAYRSPQKWSDTLENDVRGEDCANLVAVSFEFSLDLLDSGFEFEVNKFSKLTDEYYSG